MKRCRFESWRQSVSACFAMMHRALHDNPAPVIIHTRAPAVTQSQRSWQFSCPFTFGKAQRCCTVPTTTLASEHLTARPGSALYPWRCRQGEQRSQQVDASVGGCHIRTPSSSLYFVISDRRVTRSQLYPTSSTNCNPSRFRSLQGPSSKSTELSVKYLYSPQLGGAAQV